MCGSIFDCFLWVVKFHEAINQPAREAVATPDPIQNLKILTVRCLIKVSACPANCTPIVACSGLDRAQRGRSRLEIWVRLCHLFYHLLESGDIDLRDGFVDALDLEPETRGEIFFVADHHIDVPRNLFVDLLRLFLPANTFPE